MGRVRTNNSVREQREKLEISQKELGAIVGVSQPYICRIERGLVAPSVGIAIRIAEALECRVEDIFHDAEDAAVQDKDSDYPF